MTTIFDGADCRRWTLAATLLAVTACGGDAQAGDTRSAEAAPERSGQETVAANGYVRTINVEVEPVVRTTFVERIRMTGTVQANRDVTVSAEEAGTITEILIDKGRTVQAGDSILRIDDRLLRSQFDEAQARATLATETWERRKRLWEEDRVGSELAYLEARYAAEQASAALAALRRRLERTVVTAPIEGVLDDRMVELGTLVAPGTPVVRIVDLDPVKVVGGVPERYAADVRRGASATVTFDVLPGRTFEAGVGFVGAAVDPSSRTFPIEVVLSNPGRVIKPEMVANIQVVRTTVDDAVVVGQDAIVRTEDGYAVFVVDGVGDQLTARVRPIRIGPSDNDRVLVESGLEPGSRLITVGHQQVADGDRVRIVTGGDR